MWRNVLKCHVLCVAVKQPFFNSIKQHLTYFSFKSDARAGWFSRDADPPERTASRTVSSPNLVHVSADSRVRPGVTFLRPPSLLQPTNASSWPYKQEPGCRESAASASSSAYVTSSSLSLCCHLAVFRKGVTSLALNLDIFHIFVFYTPHTRVSLTVLRKICESRRGWTGREGGKVPKAAETPESSGGMFVSP